MGDDRAVAVDAQLAQPAGEIVKGEHSYLPFHSAGRLARKACMPSFWSAEAKRK